jgi:hypothetical protein
MHKSTKKFDLNIEKVLENWETYHALREVIANALDEAALSGTQDIEGSRFISSHPMATLPLAALTSTSSRTLSLCTLMSLLPASLTFRALISY